MAADIAVRGGQGRAGCQGAVGQRGFEAFVAPPLEVVGEDGEGQPARGRLWELWLEAEQKAALGRMPALWAINTQLGGGEWPR